MLVLARYTGRLNAQVLITLVQKPVNKMAEIYITCESKLRKHG